MEPAGLADIGAPSIIIFKGHLNKIRETDGLLHGLIRRALGLPGGFLARDVIYTSHAYAMCQSVCLSVTEVYWRIIANLGFKFRSHFTAHWPPCC